VSYDSDPGPGLLGCYWIGYCVCWVVVFLVSWVYCISEYGYLLGVGLGWLPSVIVASLVALLWPLVLIAIVVIAWLLFHK